MILVRKEKRLDQTVLDIEFLLISVVQGVALGALAQASVSVIGNYRFEYWLYVFSAFFFILNFWSQAIIHTLSFIDWPIDLTHNFLYFLVSFIEVMAFNQLTDPLKWFEMITIFFLVAAFLYLFDRRLIQERKGRFDTNQERKQLYRHILERQQFELTRLLPLGFLFNLGSVLLIRAYPQVFIQQHMHVILIGIQAVFGFLVLINSVGSFNRRVSLITKAQSAEGS